ncbi:hypothetical protein [Bifidobacterium animalis]|uniref:hypothetical protein n=1 Tax=Bifidobacterium animalis TaxID=28025 RepID=UPI000699A0EF|nr:hypothetical protein [Bifidobacterium animalis]KOA53752.1 hypothetical protein BAAA27672_08045 [Bifidobacterium animalis subsp. animalis ATCC 27672]
MRQAGDGLVRICGESVAIYDADGLPVALSGPQMRESEGPTVLITSECKGYIGFDLGMSADTVRRFLIAEIRKSGSG